MKILVAVESKHIGNTKKLAEAMAEVAPVTIVNANEAKELDSYDIIGFGSGIYAGRFDRAITDLAKSLDDGGGYAFVFSTSGVGNEKYNKLLIDILEKKNRTVLGSFACKGLDKFFILKLFGGTNKGKPDQTDLKNVKGFVLDVMKKYNELEG